MTSTKTPLERRREFFGLAGAATAGLFLSSCADTSAAGDDEGDELGTVRSALSSSPYIINVMDHGALGDGSGDTIAEWLTGGTHDLGLGWTTLTNIRTAYPQAQALTSTIDEVAFRRAFTAAAALGRATTYFPAGRYVFTRDVSGTGVAQGLPVPAGAQLEVRGDGISTILQRKANVVDGDHQYMIYFTIAAAATSLVFCDFALDGGGANNPEAPSPYAWEHTSTLRVIRLTDGSLDNLEFHDLWLRNPIADQLVACFNTADITNKQTTFRNIWAENRARTRADIIFYPGSEQVTIESVRATTIECEYGSLEPSSRRGVTLTNVFCDLLDFGGKGQDKCWVTATAVVAKRTLLWLIGGTFTCCDLTMDTDARLNYLSATRFDSCTFRLQVDSDTVCGVRVFRDSNSRSHIVFDGCNFVLDTTSPSLVTSGSCVREGTAVPAAQFDVDRRDLTELISCAFDARSPSAFVVGRGGRIISRSCLIAGHVAGVTVAHGSGDYYGRWESFDDDFDDCPAAAIGLMYGYQNKTDIRLSHSHWKESWEPVTLLQGTEPRFATVNWLSTRTVLLTSGPPVQGVAGDRARLITPVSTQAYEWVCTATGDASAVWVATQVFP